MNIITILRLAACAVCLAGASSASTLTDRFSNFFVLGDSLSAYAGPTGGATTQRASNGPLWSEQIIAEFEAAGQQAQSFARGGATAGLSRAIDLTAQTDALLQLKDDFDENTLVALWIGGNDIAAFGAGLAPTTSRDAFQSSLDRLIQEDVKNFLLFEVPDVGFTPLVRDFGAADPDVASAGSVALNGLFFDGLALGGGLVVDSVISGLPSDINTTVIETFELTRVAYETPEFFGAQSVGPCVIQATQLAPCELTSFWDPFHPTTRLHSFVADEVRASFATPVPLPAGISFMGLALGSLVMVRRRS